MSLPVCSSLTSPVVPLFDVQESMDQCLVVNAWSVLMVAVVLPLIVLAQLERGSRLAFDTAAGRRSQRQQAGEEEWEGAGGVLTVTPYRRSGLVGDAEEDQQQGRQQQGQQQGWHHHQQVLGQWPSSGLVELCLCSTALWVVCGAVMPSGSALAS